MSNSKNISNNTFSIATWNVNSIRARMDSFLSWMKENNPDIVLLQEIKCQEKDFPFFDINCIGYNAEVLGQKSYNGVAILSKNPITIELKGLPLYGEEITDEEARYIEGIVNINNATVRVGSVYVPNGAAKLNKGEKVEDSSRFNYKLSFLRRLKKRIEEISKFDNEYFVFGGDYNVAMKEIDLFNPEKSFGDVGFHPLEIENLQGVIDVGLIDSYRFLYPEKVAYSWWDYRRGRWPDDKGWRIDYILSSKSKREKIRDCVIHKDARGVEKASDHVPVEIIFDFPNK